MHKLNLRRARPLGFVAAAVFAVGVTSVGPGFVGPGFVAPAGAVPDAGSATIANNTLVITGSNEPDAVTLSADATQAQVSFGNDPATTFHFNLTDFTAISVSLGNGDDQFTETPGVLTDKPLTIDGGNGNDTINTGDGNDTIVAGNGDDHVDAGRGNDTVSLGNGTDSFVWTPGEGSDTVDGGNGNSDVMRFVGANGNETMSLSANGSAAVFLRNVANIRMDLANIELFDLQALGGVDNITVNDLSGTSIREANIDLAAANGAPDQAPDVVTVNGTDQADRLNVGATGTQVDVAGLAAQAHVTGSETLDRLQVNTHDGNDQVTVDPNVDTLIDVGVDLGPGQL